MQATILVRGLCYVVSETGRLITKQQSFYAASKQLEALGYEYIAPTTRCGRTMIDKWQDKNPSVAMQVTASR